MGENGGRSGRTSHSVCEKAGPSPNIKEGETTKGIATKEHKQAGRACTLYEKNGQQCATPNDGALPRKGSRARLGERDAKAEGEEHGFPRRKSLISHLTLRNEMV